MTMNEQAAFEAWAKSAGFRPEYLNPSDGEVRDGIKDVQEAWHAALAWLRSQNEPVGIVRNCSANGLRVSIMDAGLYAGQCLYAAPQPAIPAFWQLVPVNPTKEMLKAAYNRDRDGTTTLYHKTWAAMLAAAPEPTK